MTKEPTYLRILEVLLEHDESDHEAELEGEGIRYPGMNVICIKDYAFTHDDRSENGDQQPDVTYLSDDDGDDDDAEWDFDSDTEVETRCWGGGLCIVYCNPFCM